MMSQSEIVRPADLHLDDTDFEFMNDDSVKDIIDIGLSDKIKTVIDKGKFTRPTSSSSPNWHQSEIKNS